MLVAGGATSPKSFTLEVLPPSPSPSEAPAAAIAAAQAAQEQKAWLAAAIIKAAHAAAPYAHLDAGKQLPPINITLPVRCMLHGDNEQEYAPLWVDRSVLRMSASCPS